MPLAGRPVRWRARPAGLARELAAAIGLGLRRLRASGAFDALFMHHHVDLARAALETRHVIQLGNPLLPPLAKTQLWYRP